MSLLNSAEKLPPTGLEHISDEDLLDLYIRTNKLSKREQVVSRLNLDTKYLYHIIRLLGEIEMILLEGDLDLTRNNEQLKSVRRGEWSKEQITEYFQKKELELETLYLNSRLPHRPDESVIKNLLLGCLESHYGSLTKAVTKETKVDTLVKEIKSIIERYENARKD